MSVRSIYLARLMIEKNSIKNLPFIKKDIKNFYI